MTFMDTEGKTLFTTEEVEAIKASHSQVVADAEASTAIRTSDRLNQLALEWFKSEVRSGSMMKEDAEGIYNGLAEALGWATVNSLSTLYTVEVSYKGNYIAEFSDIEADDEESACDKVREDISISDINISFDVEYDNNTTTAEATLSSWEFDPSEDFEYEATEQ